jgi:hypothetical protein
MMRIPDLNDEGSVEPEEGNLGHAIQSRLL